MTLQKYTFQLAFRFLWQFQYHRSNHEDRIIKPKARKAKSSSGWKANLKNKYTGCFSYKNLTLSSLAGQEKMWLSLLSMCLSLGGSMAEQKERGDCRWITWLHHSPALSLPAVTLDASCHVSSISFLTCKIGTKIPTTLWDKAAVRIEIVSLAQCLAHSNTCLMWFMNLSLNHKYRMQKGIMGRGK